MYRLIVDLLRPDTFLVLGCLATLAMLWRARRRRRRWQRWLTAFLVTLAALSTGLAGYLAVSSLEWCYPPRSEMPSDRDTIVVLSGDVRVYDKSGEHSEVGVVSAIRCLQAVDLYRNAGRGRIVVSGGEVYPGCAGPTIAQTMRDFLVKAGIPARDVLMEGTSRTTYENARDSWALLAPQGIERIVLVTDATHMLRAAACFRAQGFDVVAAPCNYRVNAWRWTPSSFLPSVDGIGGVESAFHEWVGILWYWLHGRLG